MKLLLDQNISHRLVPLLQDSFPGTSQVSLLDLGNATDRQIWEFARKEGYSIVTKDADFEALSVLEGGPPLVVWLRCGNQPRGAILQKILVHKEILQQSVLDQKIWCVEIY